MKKQTVKTSIKMKPKQPEPMRGKLPTLNMAQRIFKDSQAQLNPTGKTRADRIEAAVNLTKSFMGEAGGRGMTRNVGASDFIRTEFFRFLLDGPRDINAECGYPDVLTPQHYRAMFDRERICSRGVYCETEDS